MNKTLSKLIYSIPLVSMSFFALTSERNVIVPWCESVGGDIEFRTKDGTYVDCLTDLYAVEAEFDYKWKEGIGQALHYAESTDKRAAILFIKRPKSRKDYYNEMMRVIDKYDLPIKIFVIDEEKKSVD